MDQRGFTFIEIVVVLALLSISYLGVSYTVTLVEKTRFETCVKEVVQSIETAQTSAMLQNKKYKVLPDTSEALDAVITQANSKIKHQVVLPSGVEVWCNTGEIIFNGDLSPAQAGTFFLTDPKLGRGVEIRVRPVTGEVAVYYF